MAPWPFRKPKKETDGGSSSSRRRSPPPKKARDRLYMSVSFATALFEKNTDVLVDGVHQPGGWHLNSRRVPVPPVPARAGEERTVEIRGRRRLLPDDRRGDPQFHPQSDWWYRPGAERDARRRVGLLGEADYPNGVIRYRPARWELHWAIPPDWEPQQQQQEEEEEVQAQEPVAMDKDGLPVAEFQPPELTEEEALQRAIDASHLEEISRWDGLFTAVRTSVETGGASSSRGPPLPPPKTEVTSSSQPPRASVQ